jgi:putative peptide zinc metalloprotease protein
VADLLSVGVEDRGLDLVLADRTRVPVVDEMTIGRGPGSTLQLDDPAVSRRQARISSADGVVMLEDAGSTYGTWLDGHRVSNRSPLRDGSLIRMGNQELLVERRRDEAEAGKTVVVQPGESLVVPASGGYPRVRSGYALKRLEESEGPRRWVLRELESNRFLRMSDADAALLQLLDGEHSLAELVGEARQRLGPTGPPRLARLLSELAERGLLSGVDGAEPAQGRTGVVQRLAAPREIAWTGAGEFFERLYRRAGWLLTRPALVVIALLVVAGLVAFPYLVVGRYGTPFVVAHKIGIGGLVFLVGRFGVVAVHEAAHGITLSSYGRRVRKAGLKLVMIFPYAYVDTSEAWFEPRRRRIAISAAGPVSDLSLGALFALCCLASPPGVVRDILFQLAFGAYLGAFFNLNPFVDRDGYQILVDLLGEPGLRRRAREQLLERRRGLRNAFDSPALARYAAFAVVWSAVAACFAVGMSLRYEPRLLEVAPAPVVWGAMAVLGMTFFLPVLMLLGAPARQRGPSREA